MHLIVGANTSTPVANFRCYRRISKNLCRWLSTPKDCRESNDKEFNHIPREQDPVRHLERSPNNRYLTSPLAIAIYLLRSGLRKSTYGTGKLIWVETMSCASYEIKHELSIHCNRTWLVLRVEHQLEAQS